MGNIRSFISGVGNVIAGIPQKIQTAVAQAWGRLFSDHTNPQNRTQCEEATTRVFQTSQEAEHPAGVASGQLQQISVPEHKSEPEPKLLSRLNTIAKDLTLCITHPGITNRKELSETIEDAKKALEEIDQNNKKLEEGKAYTKYDNWDEVQKTAEDILAIVSAAEGLLRTLS